MKPMKGHSRVFGQTRLRHSQDPLPLTQATQATPSQIDKRLIDLACKSTGNHDMPIRPLHFDDALFPQASERGLPFGSFTFSDAAKVNLAVAIKR
jgi:hypothetical protein